ncbi:MAG: ice-binding family protein [Anaeromyxobacteraceae bacterium]
MATSAALLLAAPFHAAFAQTAPTLGTARSFAVLSGAAVTCTDSLIIGGVGSSAPGGPVPQTRCTVDRPVQAGDASAVAASDDFLGAYARLAALPPAQCDATLTGTLADVSLPPGVYCFAAAATLTGQLTLDGPAGGVWIFRIGTGGTGALTGTNFSVVMAGGGQACSVYWWVADAATMTTSAFQGTILAGAASTFTGGSLIGRTLAKGAVTLTGAIVSACSN